MQGEPLFPSCCVLLRCSECSVRTGLTILNYQEGLRSQSVGKDCRTSPEVSRNAGDSARIQPALPERKANKINALAWKSPTGSLPALLSGTEGTQSPSPPDWSRPTQPPAAPHSDRPQKHYHNQARLGCYQCPTCPSSTGRVWLWLWALGVSRLAPCGMIPRCSRRSSAVHLSGMEAQPLRRIAVYCGSSAGSDPRFATAALDLGRELATRGIGVVYGGAAVGCMGAVADGALACGGEVIGVLTRGLAAREIAHPGLTDARDRGVDA